jgi:DnaJ family protein C protein 9
MPSKRKASDEDITVDEAPTSIDPYAVLSLTKDASQDQIKTAYRKAALKNHPDKAPPDEKDEANTKFQEIAFAYAILSCERRRRRYDTTGRTEESLDLEDDDFDWTTFYREQFANVVTTEAIEKFEKEYKGSEEEREHLLAAYDACEGNMGAIYGRVMLSDVLVDEDRFREIIDAAIESGEVEAYKKYTHETEKSRKGRIAQAKKNRDREAKEAEKAAQELEYEEAEGKSKRGKAKAKTNGGMGDLAALIQQRQQSRAENFFDSLEEKYAPKGKKDGKRAMDEPPEEAFAKNRNSGKSKKAKK